MAFSYNTGLLCRLWGPAWVFSSSKQQLSGHAVLVVERRGGCRPEPPRVESEASLMWQVSHLFTFLGQSEFYGQSGQWGGGLFGPPGHIAGHTTKDKGVVFGGMGTVGGVSLPI